VNEKSLTYGAANVCQPTMLFNYLTHLGGNGTNLSLVEVAQMERACETGLSHQSKHRTHLAKHDKHPQQKSEKSELNHQPNVHSARQVQLSKFWPYRCRLTTPAQRPAHARHDCNRSAMAGFAARAKRKIRIIQRIQLDRPFVPKCRRSMEPSAGFVQPA
jgi:hypothetical protein